MSNPRIVMPRRQPSYTQKDMEHAAESARRMVADSRILQTALATMIASRRLYMIARSAMDNEVQHGWEVDNPDLIIQTLVMSAQEEANKRFKIEDLHRQTVGTVLPFVDIVLQQSQETGEEVCPPEVAEDADDDESGEPDAQQEQCDGD